MKGSELLAPVEALMGVAQAGGLPASLGNSGLPLPASRTRVLLGSHFQSGRFSGATSFPAPKWGHRTKACQSTFHHSSNSDGSKDKHTTLGSPLSNEARIFLGITGKETSSLLGG